MLHLVIGPSSVGKSTFIEQTLLTKEGLRAEDVVLANELEDEPLGHAKIVHYNLFRCYENSRDNLGASLRDDEVLVGLLDRLAADDVVWVLVASRSALMHRVLTRLDTEPSLRADHGSYPSAGIFELLVHLDLPAVYRELFDELDRRGIAARVMSTEDADVVDLGRSAAVALAGANPPQQYSIEEVERVVDLFPSDYHAVEVAHGVATGGADRSPTADIALGERVEGSVLDVGCGYGYYSFEAEARGASRVVGVDMKPDRFVAACAFAQLRSSRVDFRFGGALDRLAPDEVFDRVLVLNVVHHVPEPVRFLRELAQRCADTMVIEFPNLDDTKFLATVEGVPDGLNRLPLIGVSLVEEQDQTYLFTESALTRILIDNGGLFESATFVASPISADRQIGIFRRHAPASPPEPATGVVTASAPDDSPSSPEPSAGEAGTWSRRLRQAVARRRSGRQ